MMKIKIMNMIMSKIMNTIKTMDRTRDRTRDMEEGGWEFVLTFEQ